MQKEGLMLPRCFKITDSILRNMQRIMITSLVAAIVLFLTTSRVLGVAYRYDNLHRLTRVIYDNGTQITYTYDEVGNRTRRVSTLQADSSIDGTVNFQDYAIVASRWMEEDCGYPDDWCEGADINWSNEVNWDDLSILAQQWLYSINP